MSPTFLVKYTVPDTTTKNRKMKPTETASTKHYSTSRHLFYFLFLSIIFLFLLSSLPDSNIENHTSEQLKIDEKKLDVKPIHSLSSSVIKVREYTVPGVDHVYHISLRKSGRIWVSDLTGNLVQTDLQGHQLQKIQTSGKYGYHTVTQDGDLIYTKKTRSLIR